MKGADGRAIRIFRVMGWGKGDMNGRSGNIGRTF